MKRPFIFIPTVLVASMIVFAATSLSGKHISPDTERWDIQMVKEVRIWQNLLTHYYYAEHEKYWPERKAALEKIVSEFADSRWADDAALILACGKASFENESAGAIAALEEVISRYPDGQTIVAHWYPEGGCRFDDRWLTWQGGLVFHNPDGTIRTAKPFNRDGEICHLEQEALAYFGHLKRYPRATKVMAQLFISEILSQKGDRAGATAVLEKIVANSASYIAAMSDADRVAASQPDGYHIRSLVRRPEYRAHLSLIGCYEKQDEVDKAVKMADKLLSLCSKDGWLWTINKHIGDFYNRHDLRQEAKEQYQLALAGLMRHKNDMEKRSKLVDGSDIPDNFWKNRRRELEERLAEKAR
jgi:tetratricopeptide (TPR) repeat protein